VRFPYDLPEGKSCNVWFECEDVAKALSEDGYNGKVKLLGVIKDALGKKYTSKAFKFDVPYWINKK